MPAKKEVKKVMKAAISKKPAGKQADLNPKNIALAGLKSMTLEEKMNHYQNNKRLNQYGHVDAFLNVLDAGDRQAIWQCYNYSRRGSTAASEQYMNHCKGLGSDPKKKQLLHVFLTTGRNCKGKAYLEESTKMSFIEGSRYEEEWVPFACILKKYGVAEAMRRLKKGSINFRKDADDPEEMQFRDCRTTVYNDNFTSHSADMSKKGELTDLKDFLKAKGMTTSQLSTPGDGAELAIFLKSQEQGMGKSSKGALAVADETPPMDADDPEDDAEGAGDEGNEHEYLNKLGKKSEELSQVGNMATKSVSQRLQDMLKVCNAMKSHIECEVLGKRLKKDETNEMMKVVGNLVEVCSELKKQMQSKTTVNMEKAKTVLSSGAKAINGGKASPARFRKLEQVGVVLGGFFFKAFLSKAFFVIHKL
jgi:hypothetical protein